MTIIMRWPSDGRRRTGWDILSVPFAAASRYVHFGFYWGSEIADPEKILLGKGNQYRYIIVRDEAFPKTYMKKLMKEAYANSLAKVKDEKQIMEGMTIVKSISPVKKRPGMAAGTKGEKKSAKKK